MSRNVERYFLVLSLDPLRATTWVVVVDADGAREKASGSSKASGARMIEESSDVGLLYDHYRQVGAGVRRKMFVDAGSNCTTV